MAKEKINFEDEDIKLKYRHTTSHIMAQAVKIYGLMQNWQSVLQSTMDFITISIWSISCPIRIS